MKLFGGWLPYLWISSVDFDSSGSQGCVLAVGWLMGFVFVGTRDGQLTYGAGYWEKN